MGLVSAGAMVTLGAVGIVSRGVIDGGAVAGSDHSPSTTMNRPEVPDMNGGSTQTWAPPATTASTVSAAPTVKAG
ncbi:hypothetical protein BOO86_06725 [Mycobacterium sp. CBMA 234]|nr:hypothetical protein [Mycolicibacterium sp. CBMA 234]